MTAPPPPPPEIKSNPLGAAFSALGITALLFTILPLTQMVDGQPDLTCVCYMEETPKDPPPPPPPPPIDDEIIEDDDDPPELKVDRIKPTIGIIEDGINLDVGDIGWRVGYIPVRAEDIDTEIYSIDMLSEVPKPISRISPVHVNRGRAAKVVVVFVVDERGRVQQPRIESSTDRAFNRPVLEAIGKWKFTPGIKDGRKVKTMMRQPFSFGAN